MDKKKSLLLAILITLLIVSNFFFFSTLSAPGKRTIVLARVIDGDTFADQNDIKYRLLNVNTPEKNQAFYLEAKNFLINFENQSIEIEILENDKYGRTLVRVYTPSYLNLELVKLGLAKKFLVDESEKKQFNHAEELAIQNEEGMWRKSQYSNCFSIKLDEKLELVTIKNSCKNLNIKNWIIADESRKEYIFPAISFNVITLHSSEGINNETDIFWNQKQNVWNNDKDTLYFYDNEGGLAYHKSYGY